ncbi:germin-like protein subfamily 1 member 7 isoform X4 [Coffea eugenioides]|uniref:germin-like protein subfamily 1 member 7 isoform X4 n=1 Tax=Coffea eugenioides TaxID=49369 RepID=UPI000F611FCF|nr:germin-like protein subfamily 1 member 7 isoform X4 [Coffea eugenioides]
MAFRFHIAAAILALVFTIVHASDPSPLQDFCVAVPDANAGGLNKPGSISKPLGSNVTQVNVNQIPGLNTLGVSLARLDFAPYGLNPPHIHPRATEVLFVLEGTLLVGFVTSNPGMNMKNKLFTKVLNPGDVFVFPQGLIHFQFNQGETDAVAFAGFGSQNPGVITIANAVFGSDPPISPDVLAKAFQVGNDVIKKLQSQFWWDNNYP